MSRFKLHLNYVSVTLTLICLGLAYIIFVYFNPFSLIQAQMQRSLVEKAAKLAKVELSQFQFGAELGKTQGFTDVEALKKQSKYNEEVYKDAKKGDYAIAFGEKMVLFRPSSGKLVYEGITPGQKQLADQQALLQKIVDKIKANGLITQDEVPQIATVNNASQLKSNQFYANAQDGDVVLSFGNQGVIVLYNPKSDTIVNYGKVQLTTNTSSKSASSK